MIPREVLAKIQQRADAATRGPWLPGYDQKGNRAGWAIVARTEATSIHGGDTRPIALTIFPTGGWSTEADGRFVAAARDDVPKLVAALTAVLELLDQVDRSVPADDQPVVNTGTFRTAITQALA